MADRRRVPLGRAIPRTDAELDVLSQVTIDDIAEAKIVWRGLAPATHRKLLDAKVEPQKKEGA